MRLLLVIVIVIEQLKIHQKPKNLLSLKSLPKFIVILLVLAQH